ncbi:MAG: SH3 domain-containing protein, partial [Lachnospiraceae bacterium]|nr:SH3 domain-containing protein [Lachnospiraceae bacterium]
MKRFKKVLSAIFVAALVFTGCGNNTASAASSVSSQAEASKIDESKLETMWVSGDDVNVREGQDKESQSVGKLSRGAEVKKIAVHGDWTEILFGGESRFVSTKFLTAEDPSTV